MNIPPNTIQENLLLEANYYISYIKRLKYIAEEMEKVNKDIQKELEIASYATQDYKGNYVIYKHKASKNQMEQEEDNFQASFDENQRKGQFQRENLNTQIDQRQCLDKENDNQNLISKKASLQKIFDNVLEECNQDLNLDDEIKMQILDKDQFSQIIKFQQNCKRKMICFSSGQLQLNTIFGQYSNNQKLDISEFSDLLTELYDLTINTEDMELILNIVSLKIDNNIKVIILGVNFLMQNAFCKLKYLINLPFSLNTIKKQFPLKKLNIPDGSKLILNNFKTYLISYENLQNLEFENNEESFIGIGAYTFILINCKLFLKEYQKVSLLQNLFFYSVTLQAKIYYDFSKQIIESIKCFDMCGAYNFETLTESQNLMKQYINSLDLWRKMEPLLINKITTIIKDVLNFVQIKKNILFNLLFEGKNKFNKKNDCYSFVAEIKNLLQEKYASVQFQLAISNFKKLYNIPPNKKFTFPIQDIIIIVMSGEKLSGFTLLDGSIIINIKYVLDLIQNNQSQYMNKDWRRFLMTFITHNWIHQLGHFILREFKEDWEIETPNLKEEININNKQFNLLDENDFIQLESGQILEKLLFGKVFNLTDFNLQYTNYFLDIQNWNKQNRDNFRNEMLNAIRTDKDQKLNQTGKQNNLDC